MKLFNLIIFTFLLVGISACKDNEYQQNTVKNIKDNIVFAVPFAPVAYPILKILEDGNLDTGGKKMELILWKTPDQLKALVAGGQADIFAMPSNVGVTFYNKGIDVKLLNISIWRAIWLVSRSDDKKTLADFKGEEIAMPFRGDMPHIVFMELARKQGLNPEKDFKLTYVPSPMDAAKKMIMRRADNALLIDPAVSMVIEKSHSGFSSVIAPDIYRSVDIQNEWGRLFNTENEIPFAGIFAGSEVLKNPELLEKFSVAYKKAAEWCMQNPEETAKMVIKYVPQLNEKAVAEAMRNVTLKSVDAKDVKQKLESFYSILHDSKPALIGGKLPDEAFYFRAGSNMKSGSSIRVTTLPAYMEFVMKNLDNLKVNNEQKEKLLKIKSKVRSVALPLKQAIIKHSNSIRKMSLNNKDLVEIEKLSDEISNLRIQFAEIKTDCRNQVIEVLTDKQWANLVAKYNAENVYDMGDPLGRMSPVPNYMIDVYHVDNLGLTEAQTDKLAHWSEKRHSKSVLAHSKIADIEALVRKMSLENKSKAEIIQKIQLMEKMRHKISITKTDCRDFMRKDVLKNDEWNKLTAYISKKK